MNDNTILLRHGCFGRKWHHEAGQLAERPMTTITLPHSFSRQHIIGAYKRMRRSGLYDHQARLAVSTLLAACLDRSVYYGLVTS